MIRPAGIGAGGGTIGERTDEARALYEAGEPERGLALALGALADEPDDAALLRVAADCALDAGSPEAVALLERLVAADPGAVEAAVDLAHVLAMGGDTDRALALLAGAADDQRALRALVDVCRAAGRTEEARRWAARLSERAADDALAVLELAELSLAAGAYQEAAAAFLRLRAVDADDGHEPYACHGAVEALARAGAWRRALDVAIEATRLDRHPLTTDLLAYVAAQLFGPGERPAPAWDELEPALAAERAEHRRLHVEAMVP